MSCGPIGPDNYFEQTATVRLFMQHDDWANELNRLLRSKKATRGDWDELVAQTDEA
jgi:hypothetical protein